jgi:hypothetical protein
MTTKDKIIEKQKEALNKIAFPIKYLNEKAKSEGVQLNDMMTLQICQDANWLKQIAEDCILEIESLESELVKEHKGIDNYPKEFVEWLMDENNETIIGIVYSDYDGDDIINYLFDYWINNIRK